MTRDRMNIIPTIDIFIPPIILLNVWISLSVELMSEYLEYIAINIIADHINVTHAPNLPKGQTPDSNMYDLELVMISECSRNLTPVKRFCLVLGSVEKMLSPILNDHVTHNNEGSSKKVRTTSLFLFN